MNVVASPIRSSPEPASNEEDGNKTNEKRFGTELNCHRLRQSDRFVCESLGLLRRVMVVVVEGEGAVGLVKEVAQHRLQKLLCALF